MIGLWNYPYGDELRIRNVTTPFEPVGDITIDEGCKSTSILSEVKLDSKPCNNQSVQRGTRRQKPLDYVMGKKYGAT